MSEEKAKRNKTIFTRIFVFVLIFCLLAAIFWALFHKRESYVSSEVKNTEYKAIECKSSEPKEPFFEFGTARDSVHMIKVMLTNDRVKEISYRYDGTFNSDSAAENAEAWMHADYNKYMSGKGLNAESLNPVFSFDGAKLMVSLYAEEKKINSAYVAKLFFIDGDNSRTVNELSADDLIDIYNTKGFVCEMHD